MSDTERLERLTEAVRAIVQWMDPHELNDWPGQIEDILEPPTPTPTIHVAADGSRWVETGEDRTALPHEAYLTYDGEVMLPGRLYGGKRDGPTHMPVFILKPADPEPAQEPPEWWLDGDPEPTRHGALFHPMHDPEPAQEPRIYERDGKRFVWDGEEREPVEGEWFVAWDAFSQEHSVTPMQWKDHFGNHSHNDGKRRILRELPPEPADSEGLTNREKASRAIAAKHAAEGMELRVEGDYVVTRPIEADSEGLSEDALDRLGQQLYGRSPGTQEWLGGPQAKILDDAAAELDRLRAALEAERERGDKMAKQIVAIGGLAFKWGEPLGGAEPVDWVRGIRHQREQAESERDAAEHERDAALHRREIAEAEATDLRRQLEQAEAERDKLIERLGEQTDG